MSTAHRGAVQLERTGSGTEVLEAEGVVPVVAENGVVPGAELLVDVEHGVGREETAQPLGVVRGDGGEVVVDHAGHTDWRRDGSR